MLDDIINDRPVYDTERITVPIRLAINWFKRGIVPPDLYSLPYKTAFLIIRAYDQMAGDLLDRSGGEE